MITRLPNWVWAGGWLLACIAGMVNVAGFLGFAHHGITHLTGTTTLLGAAAAQGDFPAGFNLFMLIAAFVLGAAASGLITGDGALRLGKRYGVILLLESVLLCAAVPLLNRGLAQGEWLTAGAIGLQNAMATTYSGATLRTTHLSGMFTDLGIYLGHLARGLPVEPRRLQVCAVIISGFLAGSLLGAMLFGWFTYGALYIPAALTGLAGVGYAFYRLHRERYQI